MSPFLFKIIMKHSCPDKSGLTYLGAEPERNMKTSDSLKKQQQDKPVATHQTGG